MLRQSGLPAELADIEAIMAMGHSELGVEQIAAVDVAGRTLPLIAFTLGSDDPQAPVLGFVGGVHGLERIGAGVVLAWLHHLLLRLDWDCSLHALLERVRVVLVPVVNPGGLLLGTRANPNGVDLMRNAPVEAQGEVPMLVGGHRIGPRLPWYRGLAGAPMQPESAALCALIERQFGPTEVGIVIDCHSGFGMRDRIWFPHACCVEPMRALPELHGLIDLHDRCHPNHPYVCEPQSRQYLTHGDLWDHLSARLDGAERLFMPLTLEMGSWLWVRKNPRQLFSRGGLFNPQIAHRERRVLRRHLSWFDFLLRAAASHAAWLPRGAARDAHAVLALRRWYRHGAGA